jgi:hypothetical protein
MITVAIDRADLARLSSGCGLIAPKRLVAAPDAAP